MYFSGTKYYALLFCCVLSLSVSAKEAIPVVGQSLQKPLCFIENKGQVVDNNHNTRSDIQYKLSTPGMNLYVGSTELHYQFKKAGTEKGSAAQVYNMAVSLLGADVNAKPEAVDKKNYYENYYLSGMNSDGFTANAYGKVVYKNVYPAIDWVLYVKDGHVEYDFIVHPGGDASKIKLQYDGATDLSITKDGSIAAATPLGDVQEKKPYAYESATGKEVAANFKLHNNIVSFETGNHDGTLVIDPYILWSTYWGGTGEDVATSVKVSTTGDVYVGGYTTSITGVAAGTGFDFSQNGGFDAFIAKFSAIGGITAASYFGGTGDDMGACVAVDASGTGIYLCGQTASTGLATGGAYHTTFNGGHDGFLAKFSSTLTRIWCTYYGGTGDDYARGVACDATGNVYITGQTSSSSLIASPGAYQTALSGTNDAFVAKFNSAAPTNIYSTYYGGSAIEDALAITIDGSNQAIITGQTNSIINVATSDAHQTSLSGTNDAFIAKINASGNSLIWGTYLGGTGTEQGRGIVCNTSTGDIAAIGYTTSTGGIAVNAFQPTYGGGAQDAFVTYFTSTGVVKWSTYYGGSALEFGEGVCLDPQGNVVVAGGTFSTSGIASPGALQTTLGGSYDAFVAKFTNLGQRMWGTYFGNTLYDYAFGVACNSAGQIVIAGHTTSTAGIATTGAPHSIYGGGTYDAFITKFKTDTFVLINQPYTDTLVCANGTFFISYSTNTTFQPGNTFTAKLYNAAGTFIGDIGTVTSTSSGFIMGTIPSFAPAGTGYRIRIVSSNPAMTSPDDYANITIVSALPHVTVTANNPVCVGGTLNLHATATWSISNYSWYDPSGSFFDFIADPSITPIAVTDAGTYSVVTTHNGCPDDLATTNITVNTTFPAAPTVSASSVNCENGTIHLFATEATSSPATYNWSGPAGFSSTMQNPTVTPVTSANAGTYSVIDTVNGCWSPAATVDITITPTVSATVSISVSPNDTVCHGTFVTFTATPVNGGVSPSYQWLSGGAPIVGAFSNTWSSSTLTDGEIISVQMNSNEACPNPTTATSNTIKMNVITNEPVVHIFANPGLSVHPGDSVRFTSAVYNVGVGPLYQWQRNGVDIPGATNTTYTILHVTVFDTIRLIVTSTMNCATPNFGISNEMVAHPNTAVSNVSSLFSRIDVFPNPNNGSFNISGDLETMGINNVDLEVMNALGQSIYKGNAQLQNNKLSTSINLGNIPNGVYLLQVSADNRSKAIRIVVEH